jgi:hypothetical protein
MDSTEHPRGRLLSFKEILALCRMSESRGRALSARGDGPPLIRRPGGNHLFGFEGEVIGWLESGRLRPAKAEDLESASAAAQ